MTVTVIVKNRTVTLVLVTRRDCLHKHCELSKRRSGYRLNIALNFDRNIFGRPRKTGPLTILLGIFSKGGPEQCCRSLTSQ